MQQEEQDVGGRVSGGDDWAGEKQDGRKRRGRSSNDEDPGARDGGDVVARLRQAKAKENEVERRVSC